MAKMMRKMMAMKATKMMRRMAMKKSVIAKGKMAKSSVWKGTKAKTVGGLTKADLVKNKNGKVVSKKRVAASKKNKTIMAWSAAVKAQRKALGIKGFCPVGGKTKQGQALLARVRSAVRK